jgi:hypothetical protein
MQKTERLGIPVKRAKKKVGRPPLPARERRSKTRSFRVRGQLDEYLVSHAGISGRSVSEEIEARLERSFYMDGILMTFVGEVADLLNALATAVGASFFVPELRRPDRYRAMQVASQYIIAAFADLDLPKEPEALRTGEQPEMYELSGIKIAYQVLKNLGFADPEDNPTVQMEMTMSKLGELAELARLAEARQTLASMTEKKS